MTISTQTYVPVLHEQGYLYLTNQSDADLETVLSELGNIINQTDVIANPQSKSLVTSEKFLDYHTDNHLAKYIVWHCKKQAEIGGESILCDAEKIYHQLSEDEKVELSKIHVYEHKMFPENKNSNPIVRTVDGELRFYYSFWLSREKYRETPVFKKWRALIQKFVPVKICLKENDLLIVNNHRILHGRTEINGERNLKRYWLNPEFIPTKQLYTQ